MAKQKITHLIFDLDNVLYSGKYGLEKKVSGRLEQFLCDYLGINRDESEETHRSLVRDKGYGTTIEWLIAEKGFTEIDSYYKYINPEDEADTLLPDPELGAFLASIPLPKAVLSNSEQTHIDRFLDKLGIRDQFDFIFDIRLNDFKGKPHKEAFMKALDIMKAEPGTAMFIDDYPEFVEGYRKIGGMAVLYDEFDRYASLPYKRIRSLYEIGNLL